MIPMEGPGPHGPRAMLRARNELALWNEPRYTSARSIGKGLSAVTGMRKTGCAILLAILLPFSWADDYYTTRQTPDPSDDSLSVEDDAYLPCAVCQVTPGRPDTAPPPVPTAQALIAAPPSPRPAMIARLPARHFWPAGTSSLYALMSLQL